MESVPHLEGKKEGVTLSFYYAEPYCSDKETCMDNKVCVSFTHEKNFSWFSLNIHYIYIKIKLNGNKIFLISDPGQGYRSFPGSAGHKADMAISLSICH